MSKQKLSEVVAWSHAITQSIIEANGEISPELDAELAAVDLALAEKVDSYYHVTNRLEAEALYFKSRAEEMTRIARSHAAASARIRERLKAAMVAMERQDVYGAEFRFRLSELEPKLVIDEAVLSTMYKTEVTTLVPNKEIIKKHLLQNDTVAGARLEPVFSLRAYPNRSTS